jgi:hypothetical protein
LAWGKLAAVGYKQITIRSANTMSKLNELTAGPA